MHTFDYSGIASSIPGDVAETIAHIRSINALGGVRAARYAKEFVKLREAALIRSVGCSNEIEGITSDADRLPGLALGTLEPQNGNECEIAGYRDALVSVLDGRDFMDLDEDTVKGLHGTMMSLVPGGGGEYKSTDNAIVSGPPGLERAVFMPATAAETPEAMRRMCLEYALARDEGVEPLLLIPCAILDLLCIHPFPDGNGRVSRLATVMMLYSAGFDICGYISMDEHISMTKGEYYRALRESSAGWAEDRNDPMPFVRYFLRTLLECYIDLDTRFAVVGDRKMGKSERIAATIEKSLAPVSKGQICHALPDVSPRTVEMVLSGLQKEGRIRKVGSYRDARYAWVG